jgi:hypothetical protein
MNIHVLHTAEIPTARVDEIKKHLTAVNGPMKFTFHRAGGGGSGNPRGLLFSELFAHSNECRVQGNIPEDEFVLTLTDHPNEGNYFASLQPGHMRNGFVHSGDWQNFINSDPAIPAAFTILNLVLLGMMVKDHDDLGKVTHEMPIGCINDFCSNKRDVAFKLRTADICNDCIDRMIQARISPLKIDQSLRLLENMRKEMTYNNHFRHQFEPSRIQLHVAAEDNAVLLPDFDNTRIELTEFQMALYMLFLKESEGIRMVDLVDHRPVLKKYYMATTERNEEYFRTELAPAIETAVLRGGKGAQQNISKINKEFLLALGENFCKPYLITGTRMMPCKIEIDRDYVINSEVL